MGKRISRRNKYRYGAGVIKDQMKKDLYGLGKNAAKAAAVLATVYYGGKYLKNQIPAMPTMPTMPGADSLHTVKHFFSSPYNTPAPGYERIAKTIAPPTSDADITRILSSSEYNPLKAALEYRKSIGSGLGGRKSKKLRKLKGRGIFDKLKKVGKIAVPAALAATALYTGSKYITPSSGGQKGMPMSQSNTMSPDDAAKFATAIRTMEDRGAMRRGAIHGMGIRKSLRGRGISDKLKKGLSIALPLAAAAALAVGAHKYSNKKPGGPYLPPSDAVTRDPIFEGNNFHDRMAELRKMGGMGGGKLRGRGISDKWKKGLSIGLPLAAAAALAAVGAHKYGRQSGSTGPSGSAPPITSYSQKFQDHSTLGERLWGYGGDDE